MRRRHFIKLAGGAVVWPIVARAQQPGQLPIIGYMGQGTPAAEGKRVAAFVERLRELSWIEGRTAVIEWTQRPRSGYRKAGIAPASQNVR